MKDNSLAVICSDAFSLIELLISLIVISLIISSFIPIITKKLKYQNSTLAAGVINCKKFDEKCMLCDKKECTLCSTQLNLIDGQYVDPKAGCEIKNCPDNCAKCDATGCKQCKDGYKFSSNKKCINYTDAPCLEIGNICVAKFNAGDTGGLGLENTGVEAIATVSANASIGGVHNLALCWQGRTASACNNANGSYSGCNRTVCTWQAARKICAFHGWRLPNNNELPSFAGNSISKGEEGLQMCDHYSGASAQCTDGVGLCPKSQQGNCYPDAIWSNNTTSEGTPYFYYIHKSAYGPTATDAGHQSSSAFGVRCVRNL